MTPSTTGKGHPSAIPPPSRDDLLQELDRLKREFMQTGTVLADKVAFLQTLIDTIPCPIFYKDVDGVYLGCNKAFESYVGRSREEIVGITVYDLAPKELADVYRNADLTLFRNPGEQHYEASVMYADGSRHEIFFSKATFSDANGNVAGLVGVMLDITDRKSMERALRESERQLQEVIQDFPLPTFVIGSDHAVRHWNRAMEEFSGVRAMDVVGTRDHWKAFYPAKRPCMIDLVLDGETGALSRWYSGKALKSPLLEDAHEVTEFLPHLRENGLWLKGTAARLRDSGGEVAGAIEIVENITDRKHAEAELILHRDKLEELVAERTRELSSINAELQREIAERKEAEAELSRAHAELEHQVALRTRELRQVNEELTRQSLQDGLTGISNRRYFDEFLKREWERAKREKTSLSVIIADVDCFKNYNDTYGHLAGDTCLKAVASVLGATSKRAVDLVARYGGEEFVMVLPGTDLAAATALAEDARAEVERLGIEHRTSSVPPSGPGGHTAHVTISLGVASLVPRGSMHPSRLIAAADKGLYEAKNSGRNRVANGTQFLTR